MTDMDDGKIVDIGSVDVGGDEGCLSYVHCGQEFLFSLNPGVAKPNAYSFLLLRALDVRPGDRVLDLGTGTGFLAIMAAILHPSVQVVASDINPSAVKLAEENAERNNVASRLMVLEGDLYAPLKGQEFDLILSQPRQTPTPLEIIRSEVECRRDFYHNTSGGVDGLEFIGPLISGAAKHLRKGGRLQLVMASYLPIERVSDLMGAAGFSMKISALQKAWLSPMTQVRRSYIEKGLGYSFPCTAEGREYMELVVVTGYYRKRL